MKLSLILSAQLKRYVLKMATQLNLDNHYSLFKKTKLITNQYGKPIQKQDSLTKKFAKLDCSELVAQLLLNRTVSSIQEKPNIFLIMNGTHSGHLYPIRKKSIEIISKT